ncbi:glycosyltransferase family 4 protein [Geomonas sp. RF6]|uniref:glycosyltransferase family 4 protein n=1 Tax=Geomonas sp. RF6 TaxID=2897342 RepID=UPI001E375454|nr:glycosyltransferase family 4 protein [Geomonas sp. RF6]UFS72145.1 glycosyltransferase family 4 protein [Geomonas sp. RF6]
MTVPEYTAAFRPDRTAHRILMTSDSIGGVWSYSMELAHALSRYGVEVVLATMGRPLSPDQRKEAERLQNVTVEESGYRLEWMEDPWEELQRAGEWLLSLAQKHTPELVHLNGYAHATLPWDVPCLVVAHSCVLSWWEAVRREPPPPSLDRYREMVRQGVAAADLVAAPSAAMLAAVERLYLPLQNTRVIHNARSGGHFVPGAKRELILSVGRLWDDAKNISLVERCAGALPWPVYVAGEETHPEGGQVAMEKVRTLGYLPQQRLAPWYRWASIYALPARYEPFGLTILEAAMCGCALVIGDIPTLRELWEGAAVFIDPEDGEALTFHLRALCADAAARGELAERALARSRDFTPEKMGAQYVAAYGSLLQGRRTAASR